MIQAFLQLPVVTLVRVLLGIVLAFGILPAIVLAKPRGAVTSMDAAVARSVRWVGIVLLVAHLLVLVRLFHVLPIALLCAWAILHRKGKAQLRRDGRVADSSLEDSTVPPPPGATPNSIDVVPPPPDALPPPPGALPPPPGAAGHRPVGLSASDAARARLGYDVGAMDRSRELDDADLAEVRSPIQRVWLSFTDILHVIERSGLRAFSDWAAAGLRVVRARLATLWSRNTLKVLVLMAPILGILAVSLAMRVELAFRYETLSPPEAYVFLTWAKTFAANQIFVDGLYPHGLPAFIAFLGKLTPGIDLYEIVRYTGPLIGMLLVFGIFYACLRLTANIAAALFSAGAFGLFGTVAAWHAPWIRQTGPLPQELGFALALLALPSAILAVTDREPDHLRTTFWASVAIGLIHPVSLGVFLAMAIVGAVAAGIFNPRGRTMALGVAGAGISGGVIAHLYLPLGWLFGLSIFRGMDRPFNPAGSDGSRTAMLVDFYGSELVGHNLLSYVAGGGAVLALLVALVLRSRPRTRHIGAQLGATAAVGLLVVALYDVRLLPLPAGLLGPIGSQLGMALTLALAAGVAAVTSMLLLIRRPLLRSGFSVVAASIAVAAFGLTFETGPRDRAPSEYDTMAVVTRDIMRNQDAFSYTVVGTPQQRQAVAGIGTFIELWVFARDVTVRDAQDPGFVVPDLTSLMFARDLGESLPIPTADIYIFVEKRPFPVPEQPPVGPTEEYYYNHEKRGRIMATVYAWAEYYRYYHTDMDVHYEDDDIVVYRIRRRPNPVASLASPQFKDYTWEPGVLFTGGPTSPEEVEIPWRS